MNDAPVTRSMYVEQPAFRRVRKVFAALGYAEPRPDTPGEGAFALNIIDQYATDLTEADVLDIIAWAYPRKASELDGWVRDAGTPTRLRLSDIRGYNGA